MPAKKKKNQTGRGEAARPLPVIRTRRPSRGPVQNIAVRFPVAYLHIIESEGATLGVSRGQFLTMLVKRKEGTIMLERPPGAPSYEVTEKELSTTQLYLWQVAPEVRQRIDSERLRMGNIAVAAYLIHLVNDWLGKPMGLQLRSDGKKRSG
jgi:hypothetical protein